MADPGKIADVLNALLPGTDLSTDSSDHCTLHLLYLGGPVAYASRGTCVASTPGFRLWFESLKVPNSLSRWDILSNSVCGLLCCTLICLSFSQRTGSPSSDELLVSPVF